MDQEASKDAEHRLGWIVNHQNYPASNDDADIVFLTFFNWEEAVKLIARARNLPQTNNPEDPRFVMYVDPRARKRYNAIQNIAKTIRTKCNGDIQTSVRNGKFDNLLRQKPRGDQTPWDRFLPSSWTVSSHILR